MNARSHMSRKVMLEIEEADIEMLVRSLQTLSADTTREFLELLRFRERVFHGLREALTSTAAMELSEGCEVG